MTQRHKVFISYYHEDDQYYRDEFERLFSSRHDIIVSKSVNIGDIDPNDNQTTESVRQQIRDKYIRDATVIVVLVGARTWQRKYVDWEIYSGLRDTKRNPRCGLLGILLPTYPGYSNNQYNSYTIPPRLNDNLKCGFATIKLWTEDPNHMQSWIDVAFQRRNQKPDPDLSRDLFAKNRTGEKWQ